MIKEEELLDAIAECQGQRNPNANTCIKLASYYTILDHIDSQEKKADGPKYSFASGPEDVYYSSDTDFGRAVQRLEINGVLEVMDELMTTLSVLNPRLYDGVLRKLDE